MIIDIHSHIAYAPIYPEHFLSGMFTGLSGNEKNKLSKLLPVFLKDINGSVFLKQMDLAGIDKTVLLIIDGGIALGEAKLSIEEIYKIHFDILIKNPDRFIVFAGIDPRRGQVGFDLFRKGIEEYSFKGLKLYPPLGVSMNDNKLYPYYEYCQNNKLPVLIHTGASQENLRNELANPLFIRPIAEKYPGVTFILAHAGFGLNVELVQLIENTNNIYIDIAGFQSKYQKVDERMKNELSILFSNEKINRKVLFGTDWPLFNFMHPVSRQVEQIKELSSVCNGRVINALENILFENARKVLNIF
jgi:predicted TIM-barrel fold metal-dependent hydrolase